jgi:hypothetical protein
MSPAGRHGGRIVIFDDIRSRGGGCSWQNLKTRAAALRLLCANCHRVVHAKRPWLTFEELTDVLRGNGAGVPQ